MQELHNSVKFDNLLCEYVGNTKDKDFSIYNDAKSLSDMIRDKKIRLSDAKKNKKDLKSDLADIKIGGSKKQQTKRGNKKC